MNAKITFSTFFGLIALGATSSHVAHASQTWQSFCSNITASHSTVNANDFNATDYTVQASDNAAVQMVAQQLTASKSNNTLSSDQFQRVTNITSAGILNFVLNHHVKQCNKNYYTDSLAPLMNSLQNGNNVSFTWNNVRIQNSKVSYQAKQLTAQLSGQNNNVHIIIHFSGLSASSQRQATPAAFAPEWGDIDLTMSPKAYSLILAATGGNTDSTFSNATFPVTINNLNMQNAQTAIMANGNVTINNRPTLTSANGILKITNMQALIAASNQSHNSKLKTGLILAKFAGRNAGKNILEWNIQWQGNLFKVNSVPIPVW